MADRSVLVVGAGPVGLVAASQLMRGGVSVRLVDRLPEPTKLSKAVVVHARTLEILRAMGLAERFVESGVAARSTTLAVGPGAAAEIDFKDLETVYPFALCLPQDVTETILREHLTSLGGTIERSVELTGLDQSDDGVTATLAHGDESTERADFAYVVACDGGKSTARTLVGTRLDGSFKGAWSILADCEADLDLPRERLYMFLGADGMFGYFPLPGTRCRLVVELAEKPADGAEPTLEETQALADARTGGAFRLRDPHWLTHFEVHHGQVPSYRFERVFLAGDAAHVHSPAGGQGMNTGIQDGVNLAWKLALATSGGAAPGLLDSYHAERHPVGAHVVAFTTAMTAAVAGGGTVARHAREVLLPFLAGHMGLGGRISGELSELSIAYHDSPIVGGVPRRTGRLGHLRPGDLAPDVDGVVVQGRRSRLVDVLDPTLHTALFFGGRDTDRRAETAQALRKNFGPRLRVLLLARDPGADDRFDAVAADADGAAAARYGAGDGLLAIVRPDRYLAYLGGPGDVEDAESVLARTIG